MARPEQVRPRGGEESTTAFLEDLVAAEPIDDEDDRPSFAAMGEGAADVDGLSIFEDDEADDVLDDGDPDGLDEMLFQTPTLFPDEPMETGLPFGPGPSFIPRPPETERDFLNRVARELRDSPASSPLVRDFADRIERGE